MTSKFLQALTKLKPSSPGKVHAERKKSPTSPRGAVAFQADVYRGNGVPAVTNVPRAPVAEHK
jgi:hypothetical protein